MDKKYWIAAALVVAGAALMASNRTVRGLVMMPRGIRNKNPGNIRRTGTAWQGMATEQTDPAFLVFSDPLYGIRALARTLRTYMTSHGLTTVRGIVNRWAPPVGKDQDGKQYTQDTSAYVTHVAKAVGVGPDEPLAFTRDQLARLVEAIIKHENGVQPYDRALVLDGIRAAGWTV